MENNYMEQLPGGHCFVCHTDYKEIDHNCWGDGLPKPSDCGEQCKDTKYPMPDWAKPSK